MSSLEDLAKELTDRIRNDFDVVAAITGYEGVGKTTLSILLAMLVDPNFVLEKNMLFQPKAEELKTLITKSPKYSCLIADEAVRILYKHRRFDKLQIYLTTLFQLCRQENQIVLLNIPRYTDLNAYFRDHRCLLWIHVYKRGKALVFIRDQNPFTDDPWHMQMADRNFFKLARNRQLFEMAPEYIAKTFTNITPNFFMHVEFDDLPKDVTLRYKALKAKFAYLDLDHEFGLADKSEERFKARFYFLCRLLISEFGIGKTLLFDFLATHDLGLKSNDFSTELSTEYSEPTSLKRQYVTLMRRKVKAALKQELSPSHQKANGEERKTDEDDGNAEIL